MCHTGDANVLVVVKNQQRRDVNTERYGLRAAVDGAANRITIDFAQTSCVSLESSPSCWRQAFWSLEIQVISSRKLSWVELSHRALAVSVLMLQAELNLAAEHQGGLVGILERRRLHNSGQVGSVGQIVQKYSVGRTSATETNAFPTQSSCCFDWESDLH